jgi:hypothetical protein
MSARAKPWICPEGHILGLVERRVVEGRREKSLTLYRHAVDLTAQDPAEIEVMAVVQEMTVMTVTCDVCGKTRMWTPGEDALLHLVNRVLVLRDHHSSINSESKVLEVVHAKD